MSKKNKNNFTDLFKIVLVIVVLVLAYNWWQGQQAVKSKDFESHTKNFKLQIDSLKTEVRAIKVDTDSLKRGQQYLQKGQEVIFHEVKKDQSGFFDKLIEFGL